MKKFRIKVFDNTDGSPMYVLQKRWLLFFWLTPYLAGNFRTGFYDDYRLFSYGQQFSWYENFGDAIEAYQYETEKS